MLCFQILVVLCLHVVSISHSRKSSKSRHVVVARSSPASKLYDPTIVRINVSYKGDHSFTSETDSNPERFKLPRELICASSIHFENLFSRECRAQLHDVRPWVFKVFMGWLYCETVYYDNERVEPASLGRSTQESSQALDEAKIADELSSEPGTESQSEEKGHDFRNPVTWPYSWLFELYVFAKVYKTRGFQLDILELIQLKGMEEQFVPLPDTIFVINNIFRSDPLYQLLAYWYSDLDMVNFAETVQEQVEALSNLPSHFCILFHAMYVRRDAAEKCSRCRADEACNAEDHSKEDRIRPYLRNPCFYHDYGGDKKEENRCYWRWFARRYCIKTISYRERVRPYLEV